MEQENNKKWERVSLIAATAAGALSVEAANAILARTSSNEKPITPSEVANAEQENETTVEVVSANITEETTTGNYSSESEPESEPVLESEPTPIPEPTPELEPTPIPEPAPEPEIEPLICMYGGPVEPEPIYVDPIVEYGPPIEPDPIIGIEPENGRLTYPDDPTIDPLAENDIVTDSLDV